MFSSKNQKSSSSSSSNSSSSSSSSSFSSIGADWWNKINNSLSCDKFNRLKSSSLAETSSRRQQIGPRSSQQQANCESHTSSSSSTYSSSLLSNSSSTQKSGRLSIEVTPRNSSSSSSCSSSIVSSRSNSRASKSGKSSTTYRIKCIKQNSFKGDGNNSRFNIIDYLDIPTKLANLTRSSTSKPVAVAKSYNRYNTTTLDTTINTRLSAARSSSLLSRKLNRSFRIGSGQRRNNSVSSLGNTNTSRYYAVRASQNHHRFGSTVGSGSKRNNDSCSAKLVQQFKQEANRWLKGLTSDL